MVTTKVTSAERVGGPETAQPELLSVEDVATLLRCSPRHIYRLADRGHMPRPVKLGALVRWSRRSVLKWVCDGCRPRRSVKGVPSHD